MSTLCGLRRDGEDGAGKRKSVVALLWRGSNFLRCLNAPSMAAETMRKQRGAHALPRNKEMGAPKAASIAADAKPTAEQNCKPAAYRICRLDSPHCREKKWHVTEHLYR
ncbi:hypothetical protein MRX96_035734 [Rhipicephalus microplus]